MNSCSPAYELNRMTSAFTPCAHNTTQTTAVTFSHCVRMLHVALPLQEHSQVGSTIFFSKVGLHEPKGHRAPLSKYDLQDFEDFTVYHGSVIIWCVMPAGCADRLSGGGESDGYACWARAGGGKPRPCSRRRCCGWRERPTATASAGSAARQGDPRRPRIPPSRLPGGCPGREVPA
jgi:hypothetical protein